MLQINNDFGNVSSQQSVILALHYVSECKGLNSTFLSHFLLSESFILSPDNHSLLLKENADKAAVTLLVKDKHSYGTNDRCYCNNNAWPILYELIKEGDKRVKQRMKNSMFRVDVGKKRKNGLESSVRLIVEEEGEEDGTMDGIVGIVNNPLFKKGLRDFDPLNFGWRDSGDDCHSLKKLFVFLT